MRLQPGRLKSFDMMGLTPGLDSLVVITVRLLFYCQEVHPEGSSSDGGGALGCVKQYLFFFVVSGQPGFLHVEAVSCVRYIRPDGNTPSPHSDMGSPVCLDQPRGSENQAMLSLHTTVWALRWRVLFQ